MLHAHFAAFCRFFPTKTGRGALFFTGHTRQTTQQSRENLRGIEGGGIQISPAYKSRNPRSTPKKNSKGALTHHLYRRSSCGLRRGTRERERNYTPSAREGLQEARERPCERLQPRGRGNTRARAQTALCGLQGLKDGYAHGIQNRGAAAHQIS